MAVFCRLRIVPSGSNTLALAGNSKGAPRFRNFTVVNACWRLNLLGQQPTFAVGLKFIESAIANSSFRMFGALTRLVHHSMDPCSSKAAITGKFSGGSLPGDPLRTFNPSSQKISLPSCAGTLRKAVVRFMVRQLPVQSSSCGG